MYGIVRVWIIIIIIATDHIHAQSTSVNTSHTREPNIFKFCHKLSMSQYRRNDHRIGRVWWKSPIGIIVYIIRANGAAAYRVGRFIFVTKKERYHFINTCFMIRIRTPLVGIFTKFFSADGKFRFIHLIQVLKNKIALSLNFVNRSQTRLIFDRLWTTEKKLLRFLKIFGHTL